MELVNLKTKFTPATLKIDLFEEFKANVKQECEKIASLVITEENAQETKKDVITPLKKQLDTVDKERIKAKKEATKQLDEVHNEMKQLYSLLEEAQTKVDEELSKIELKRKTEKQAKIDELITEHGNGKNIVQENDWLNKSKKLNEIEIAIKNQLFHIEKEEELKKQQVKQLETTAELLEVKNGIEVNVLPYASMLAHLELDDVIKQMETDVANIIKKREEEKKRAEQQEKVEVVETQKVEVPKVEAVEEKELYAFKVKMTPTQAKMMKEFIKNNGIEVV